eukprot:CAMPEP_0197073138 /NCGR_PEP_ID=MMETSP1384-20130603/210452_1 /TAXON_ID=29189 /ORGANISM="Ammonia sp." /LENGTH=296 /DNA_ID=CAMNT_0042511969 /DNA_START=13 /DNA_END=904 /DNA_ORIENTATION=+
MSLMSATVISVLLIAICSAVTSEDQIPIPPDTKKFISQIAIVLEETCARNTNLSAVPPPAEGFNLGAISHVTTERWLERAAKYGKVTAPVFVHSFIYLHQWSEQQGQPLSLWNIDKLVAAAVTVAHKNHDDNFYAKKSPFIMSPIYIVICVLLIANCAAVPSEYQIPIPPDTRNVISQIAIVLDETCTLSTDLSAAPPPAEGFNLGTMSDITIERWLERAAKYAKISAPVFVHSFIYLHRWSVQQETLTLWNIDKLVAAAVTVAHKNHDDNFYANSWYAQIFGLKTEGVIEAKSMS